MRKSLYDTLWFIAIATLVWSLFRRRAEITNKNDQYINSNPITCYLKLVKK